MKQLLTFFQKSFVNYFKVVCLIGLFSTAIFSCKAQNTNAEPIVYQLDINESIFPASWRKTKKAVEEAERLNAAYIVVQLNTYGGLLDTADSIRTKLMNTKIPTVVYINTNAASAGALISIACDSIYMSPGAQMGAATVVNQVGRQLPDKYQSYMRATMRSTAEAQGRDPQIAEAMVDDRIRIPGIIDSTKTLTFTTQEAITYGYCEGEFTSLNDVLKHLQVADYEKITYKKSLTEGLITFLINPFVKAALLMVLFGGIFFEMKTPGVGFPILAAAVAALLFFAPSYIEGLAQHWEILLFILGLVLIGLEIFVVPGFGVTGVGGISCVIIGLVLSLLNNNYFDFTETGISQVLKALMLVILPITAYVTLLLFMGERLLETKYFKRVSLQTTQESSEGYTVEQKDLKKLVGKTGKADSVLRPSGRVLINGDIYDAISDGEWIQADEVIVVKDFRGSYLIVKSEEVVST